MAWPGYADTQIGKSMTSWRESLGFERYRVTITMSGYGSDEEAASKLLKGHLQLHPDVGPTVSQDSEEDTIAVTVTVAGAAQYDALDVASEIWVVGGEMSGLRAGEILKAEVVRLRGKEAEEAHELSRAFEEAEEVEEAS